MEKIMATMEGNIKYTIGDKIGDKLGDQKEDNYKEVKKWTNCNFFRKYNKTQNRVEIRWTNKENHKIIHLMFISLFLISSVPSVKGNKDLFK